MEWFWKWLAKTAEKELAKKEVKRRVNGIINRLDSMSGEMATYFEVLGSMLKQEFCNITSRQLSDIGRIWNLEFTDAIRNAELKFADSLERKTSALKYAFEEGWKSMTGQVCGVEGTLLKFVNDYSHKSDDRHDELIRCFEEATRQASVHDSHGADRMLTILDKLRHIEAKMDQSSSLAHGVQVGTFESLTAQIQALRVPQDKQRFNPAPTLEWIFDNVDNFMKLGNALQVLRNNDAPRSAAKMEAIRCIRALELYSVLDVRDEVERLISLWDNDQQICQAA